MISVNNLTKDYGHGYSPVYFDVSIFTKLIVCTMFFSVTVGGSGAFTRRDLTV